MHLFSPSLQPQTIQTNHTWWTQTIMCLPKLINTHNDQAPTLWIQISCKPHQILYSSFVDAFVTFGKFPGAFSTANVAQVLLTVWWAKITPKSGSGLNVPSAAPNPEPDPPTYLNKKIRACIGFNKAKLSVLSE